jgi:cobalt-zinc-cadmium efflux system protein
MATKHSHKPKQDSISDLHEYRNVQRKKLVLTMLITGTVMVLEAVGGVLTGSLALLSDAGHMFTHLFAFAISFTAIIIACKEPCHHRTYGFYRVEILAALFNSLFLFAVTALILFQGIQRLLHPQPVIGFEMLLVAIAGLAANGLSILILRKSVKNDLNIKGAFLHMFADTISSVAIVVGGIIVVFTNFYIIDPLMGIGISILIFVWAWGLFKDSVNVLLETAPKGMHIDYVSAELKKNIPEIIEIDDMHIWEITSNMYSFTAHIRISEMDQGKSNDILNRINEFLDEKYAIEHTTIQIETTT